MFTFLRKIQQRPERERRSIALWTAFWITLLVFLFWAIAFFTNINQFASTADTTISEEVSPINNSTELLSKIWDSFGSLKGSILNR